MNSSLLDRPTTTTSDSTSTSSGFQVRTRRISLFTEEPTEFIDITADLQAFVADSGVVNGVVVVYAAHTTAGIAINEAEPLLLDDMRRLLEQFAPRGAAYQHDDLSIRTVNLEPNERANGHAHCQRLLIGASESIPIVDGVAQLGRWQSVFFVELDGPRPREIRLQALGL